MGAVAQAPNEYYGQCSLRLQFEWHRLSCNQPSHEHLAVGKHYVPQALLRNFQIPTQPGFIWLYDKHDLKPHVACISKVAQSQGYYSAETEVALARDVEIPGNRAIERLLHGELLSPSERIDLSYYICTTLMRGPRRRRKAHEKLPQVLAETTAEIRSEIAESAATADLAWVTHCLAEVDAAEQKFSSAPPPLVIAHIQEPWPYESMVDAVDEMAWRVLESSGPSYFITSDNPVFLVDCFGLAQQDSEISFPLSTTKTLHGCQEGKPRSLTFMQAPQWLVRETNRRLVSETERLVFCHEEEPWLPQMLSKKHPFLSVIKW